MSDTRLKHLFIALIFFFVVIFMAGVSMILASRAIRDAQVFWLAKQALPVAILAAFLVVGTVVFDRIKIPYAPIIERANGVKGLLPFVPLGGLLFLISVLLVYAIEGRFSSNNVYAILPHSRFYPYFILTFVFTGLIQPILEERIFRGRIFPIASGVIGISSATVLVSALFSLLHYSNIYSSLFFSVVMCVVALRYGIRACITTHISYNVISILVDAF